MSEAPGAPGGPTTASGSRAQVARLLTLVPYLHARGGVSVAEASEALGVTPAQLLKDLRVLFLCGLPGGYPDELIDVDLDAIQSETGRVRLDGMIRIGNADYLSRPLRLSATEASAVIVALRALRAGAQPETAEIVDRVLAKLESAASSGSVPVAVSDSTTTADAVEAELAAQLERAVTEQRQVELDYWVPARDEMSHRTVDPRRLVRHGGATYLDAWCHVAEAPRSFRLDRVAEARVLDVAVRTEAEPAGSLDEGFFTQDDDGHLVTLRLDPAASWITEYYPIRAVRRVEQHLEVDLLVADRRWLTRLLLRLAPHARVLAPAELVTDLTVAAQETLALYS